MRREGGTMRIAGKELLSPTGVLGMLIWLAAYFCISMVAAWWLSAPVIVFLASLVTGALLARKRAVPTRMALLGATLGLAVLAAVWLILLILSSSRWSLRPNVGAIAVLLIAGANGTWLGTRLAGHYPPVTAAAAGRWGWVRSVSLAVMLWLGILVLVAYLAPGREPGFYEIPLLWFGISAALGGLLGAMVEMRSPLRITLPAGLAVGVAAVLEGEVLWPPPAPASALAAILGAAALVVASMLGAGVGGKLGSAYRRRAAGRI